MEIIRVEETDSTNNWILRHEENLSGVTLVYCVNQTSGRGQRGNTWESEPGKNITASIIFHPDNFPACQQFVISEAVALSIVDFLASMDVRAKVKWPNDIYVEDKKICGILVEHKILGSEISRTIAGFGININQTRFISEAPNPISVKMLTGENHEIDRAVNSLSLVLEKYLNALSEDKAAIHDEFISKLWRNDGSFYPFFDRKNNERINARIKEVAKDGILTLTDDSGNDREFMFKEVEFLLNS